MNKAQLVKHYHTFCTSHGLSPCEVVVGAGGTLTLLGLRKETSDIDVSVSVSLMVRFLKAGTAYHYFGSTLVVEGDHLVDMLSRDREIEIICVDGVWCESPETVLAFKRHLNRPKDQADIKALERYLQG